MKERKGEGGAGEQNHMLIVEPFFLGKSIERRTAVAIEDELKR